MNDHDEAHLFDDLGSSDSEEQAEMDRVADSDDDADNVRLSSFYSLNVAFSRAQDVTKCVEWLLNGPLGYESDEITTVSRTLMVAGDPVGQYEVFVTTEVIDTFPVFAEHIAMHYIGVKSVLLKAHYDSSQEYAEYALGEIAAEQEAEGRTITGRSDNWKPPIQGLPRPTSHAGYDNRTHPGPLGNCPDPRCQESQKEWDHINAEMERIERDERGDI